jgi:Tfp pilus assembly protein PilF
MTETGVGTIFEALQAGDHLLAAQHARARLADHPTDGETWFMLGIAERALGDPAAAAASYQRALVTHDGHADVWFNLGNALVDCGEPDRALEAFGAAADRLPGHVRALQQVIRLGQDPAARAALRQRLADAQARAPLFQPVGRVREWEWAWAEMARRHQAGLPPAAFDVPEQSPAPAGAATVSS